MHRLEDQPVHLGLGATAVAEPHFTGMEWYEGYALRHGADGHEGRLVCVHRFEADWPMWEMHPHGEEVVVCLSGTMTLYQEMPDGSRQTAVLAAGDYAINPRGCWHTADVAEPATALFVTAGAGTEHRLRQAPDSPARFSLR